MKCMEYEQMSRHIEGETEGREKIMVDTHILNCRVCEKLYAHCMAEKEAITKALRAPVLPDSFTEEVMSQLVPYPVSSDVPEIEQPPPAPKSMKKRRWRRWAYAAAGTVLAISLAASVSPSFASYLSNSIFNRGNQMIDGGLQLAGENGFVQRGDYHISDKGTTLRVLEVVADPTRIALSYMLEKEGGGHLDPYFEERFDNRNRVYITDTAGNKLADSSSWSRNDPYGIMTFQPEKSFPEKVVVHFDLTRVGGIAGIGGKEGKWNLQIPVEMKKGMEATRTVQVNQRHETPQGVNIVLSQLLFAPTKTQVELVTSLSPSLRAQLSEMIKKGQSKGLIEGETHTLIEGAYGISYRIIDESGRVVAGKSGPVHHSREHERNNIESTGMHELSGRTVWKDGFVPFQDAKRLTFILDAVDIEEAADFSLSFSPDEARSKEVGGSYKGNVISVKDFTINSEWDLKKSPPFLQNDTHAIIEVEGMLTKDTGTLFNWSVVDEQGKTYKVMMSGDEEDPDASGNRKFKGTLHMYGMKHKPEKLTLKLERVMKRHTDVNWKTEISVTASK
ncbi:DUF4179 domain-containing protein [Aneurinibacillus sp. REN35]|uniref:DUF4179 domain-containing protein n=1 Tax=Aneurinibacillus sp. REN35 TaxID=3237286 RepID=UPI0035290A7E